MELKIISERYMKFSAREKDMGYISPILNPVISMKYIADCIEAGHKLIGISGFYHFRDGKIQPDQRFELDITDYRHEEEFLNEVGKIIFSQLYKDVVFEIAFEEVAG